MKDKKPTMKDVAKLAGVTQPTVSYVINGTAMISDEVKERVYKAIEDLHYVPNYNAVALKTNRSRMVGILVPDITNSYYSVMASYLEKRLTKEGYTVLINSTGYKNDVEVLILRQLLLRDVEAFIVTYQFSNPACWDMLKVSQKEVITIEAGNRGAAFPEIRADSFLGASIATEYLLRTGRKKIAYVGQDSTIDELEIRENGYIATMNKAGLQPLILHVEKLDEKSQEGVRIGTVISSMDVDGLLVSSDEIAVGIVKTLLSMGIRVPEDISIIGYDDIPIAKLFMPELSTVAQPIYEICMNAVEMLMKGTRGESIQSMILKPVLHLRKTTMEM